MYAKKAGITGKMQGARNEPSPAIASTAIVMSATKQISYFFIKALFQIFVSIAFYLTNLIGNHEQEIHNTWNHTWGYRCNRSICRLSSISGL
jgi:hypothetical protein